MLTEHSHKGLLRLQLSRPEAANALHIDLVELMIRAIENAYKSTRFCAITGAGKHFCAGFDLSDLDDVDDATLLWRILRIEHLLQLVHHAPFPIAAFAHGSVMGAGADLFAACTYRIASPEAKFRMPGWNFELALGTRRLKALIGSDKARDMLIDTRTVKMTEALEIGLATECGSEPDWPKILESLVARSKSLPKLAVIEMLRLTANDTREQDVAAIVQTAGRPGLKRRIQAYRDRARQTQQKSD